MQDWVASRTALRVAVRRAEHQVLDTPRVFEDPLSIRIIGPELAAKIRPGVVTRTQRLSPSFRAFMAVRSRWAEDELANAVEAGVRQYVVLGAGLDTFAYRNPWGDAGLLVFEVDHPATQAWKRERLASAGIEVPETAEFVAADFEHVGLAEALAGSGFRTDSAACFSWLGVTPYLTERAFEETLRYVAGMPAESRIAFDYAVRRESLNEMEQMALDALSERVANAGEPFQLFLEPGKLRETLLGMGFRGMEDLGRDAMNARYFGNRPDGFRVKGNLGRLVLATT